MQMTDENLSTDLTLAAEAKLYYDLFAPNDGPAPLLVALHGYGSNKGWMMREARHHAPEGFAVASLQGPHQHLKEAREPGGPLRYGFGWLTNFRPEDSIALHHRALLSLIDSLVEENIARRERVFLLGFSQSCALNYRFAFTHRAVLRGVTPAVVVLLVAAAWSVGRAGIHTWVGLAMAVAAALVLLRFRVNPFLVMLGAGLLRFLISLVWA